MSQTLQGKGIAIVMSQFLSLDFVDWDLIGFSWILGAGRKIAN